MSIHTQDGGFCKHTFKIERERRKRERERERERESDKRRSSEVFEVCGGCVGLVKVLKREREQ